MLEIIARLFLAIIRLILYEFRNLVLRTDKEGILYWNVFHWTLFPSAIYYIAFQYNKPDSAYPKSSAIELY